MKNEIKTIKSSQKLANFLEKNSIHKKDFAEMIGVTLSYVYNLVDETIPFSTRSTTSSPSPNRTEMLTQILSKTPVINKQPIKRI